jgi:hypothetical protein
MDIDKAAGATVVLLVLVVYYLSVIKDYLAAILDQLQSKGVKIQPEPTSFDD